MNLNRNEVLKKISLELGDTPTEIPVNVIILGESARKLHYVKTIISNTNPEFNDEDVFKFILRSGVERELERINKILNDE